MMTTMNRDDAMENWAAALATAPHVLQGAVLDDPASIQLLADSSASLHGLVAFIYDQHAVLDVEKSLLEWDLDLLAGASGFLYRNLGLSEEQSMERLGRLSGAMQGTARYMDTDPLAIWSRVRVQAEKSQAKAA